VITLNGFYSTKRLIQNFCVKRFCDFKLTLFRRIFPAFLERSVFFNDYIRQLKEEKKERKAFQFIFSLFFHQLSFRLWAKKAPTEKIKEKKKTEKVAPKKNSRFDGIYKEKKDSFLSKLFTFKVGNERTNERSSCFKRLLLNRSTVFNETPSKLFEIT
jgi:hypothetical protein